MHYFNYRIYSIKRPGRLLIFGHRERALLRGGRLFEAGRLLNFHYFQQVKYVYFAKKKKMLITKREEVTK